MGKMGYDKDRVREKERERDRYREIDREASKILVER